MTAKTCCFWLVGCALASCCSPPPPPAEKFFDHSSALETLKGFVYAVDTHQWDYAYDCLNAASRAEIGRFKFEAALRWSNDPYYHEVPVADIISSSVYHVLRVEEATQRAKILVAAKGRNSRGVPFGTNASLFFVKEENEQWLFDFLETVNAMPGNHAPPSEDLSYRE